MFKLIENRMELELQTILKLDTYTVCLNRGLLSV